MTKQYKVANHYFAIKADAESCLWEKMCQCYGPFEDFDKEAEVCFTLVIKESAVDCKDKVAVYSNADDRKEGFIIFSVFKTGDNNHYFELSQPYAKQTNGYMTLSSDFSCATLNLAGTELEQWNTFNTAVTLCFQLATSKDNTLLLHASAVEYQERAYLFLGKSGTGKSTHSRMWLEALNNVTLINDDHPVVRVYSNGEITAYGSPWSGKTHCYKNISYPLGGVIRIVRAEHNRAVRLSAIQSYASIMTSCGGMVWLREFADNRDRAIQNIISQTPCWNMECLPNSDAAIVCSSAVTAMWNETENRD